MVDKKKERSEYFTNEHTTHAHAAEVETREKNDLRLYELCKYKITCQN